MKIKVQSLIDIITNSSTETFTVLAGNAEEIITNLVNDILRAGGSSLKFSDLFVYDTKFDDNYKDQYYDYIVTFIGEHEDDCSKVLLKAYDSVYSDGWTQGANDAGEYIFKELLRRAIDKGAMNYDDFCENENESDDNWDRWPALLELDIKVKPNILERSVETAAKTLNCLGNLFSSDYRAG